MRKGTEIPLPDNIIGPCHDHCKDTNKLDRFRNSHGCTSLAKFNRVLSRVGWTTLNTFDLKSLLEHHNMSIHHFPHLSSMQNTG